ncbi:hypothetical protein ACFSJU_12520 [Paradesertivirga mongoliensis]|uniref:Uncharacterized protein n=1 Tax=Paradesertivirga mongoliensis TaxID=2100740 RepID=A0ABW4ZN06_9SPHI|nr:hypothetical protein [Pedobacter mongoliensis]
MDVISKDEFKELANHQADGCVSIYIPTHSSGVEVNEKYDTLVFKNNVQKARVQLTGKGYDVRKVDAILAPAVELIRDEEFWNNQSKGLAVFMSEKFFKMYQLPLSVKEEVLVNSSFLLTPLLPVMERRHRFYLLVLSKHACKFYEGDQFEMKKLEIAELPTGMDDVVPFELKEARQIHRRAGAAAGSAASVGASFHGHGSGLSDEDEYLLQYLKEVDQTLWTEVLHNQHVPLVLASVDYEIAYYKQISNYKHISEVSLTGNYEHEDRQSLYLKVKDKLAPYFREYSNDALKNYYNNSAKELTTSIPEEVIPAAYFSQVSDLFVQKDQRIWGKFDENNNSITINEQKQEDDECLINKAIIKTLMNGGEVHMLEKEKMPADTPIAAFMRYSL